LGAGSVGNDGLDRGARVSVIQRLDHIYDLLNCIAEGDDHRPGYLLAVQDPRSLLLVEPLRYLIATQADWLILEQVPEKARSWTLFDPDGTERMMTPAEAGQLQTFPPDYAWTGTRSAQFLQIANAVPPLLATHVLSAAGIGQSHYEEGPAA
jgi:hypothetical protein